MTVSAVSPDNSDRRSISFCAPLSRKFPCKTFNKSVDLIWSDAIKSGLRISGRAFLTTSQNGFDCLSHGLIIHGEHSPYHLLIVWGLFRLPRRFYSIEKMGGKFLLPRPETHLLYRRLSGDLVFWDRPSLFFLLLSFRSHLSLPNVESLGRDFCFRLFYIPRNGKGEVPPLPWAWLWHYSFLFLFRLLLFSFQFW